MFKFSDEKGQLKCSFCGKTQEQVRKLVAGPGVYICDECIELCNEIIEEEIEDELELNLVDLPKPVEIHGVLDKYVIGQEDAKKFFVAVYNHYKRVTPARRPTMWSCRKAISANRAPRGWKNRCCSDFAGC